MRLGVVIVPDARWSTVSERWQAAESLAPDRVRPGGAVRDTRSRRRLTSLCLALVAALACDAPTRELDLVERLPAANAYGETDRIDLGEDAARAHLLEGWSWNETSGRTRFVWAVGRESSVWIQIASPAPRSLRMRVRPFAFPGAAPQRISLSANGTSLGETELDPTLREYRVAWPASAQRAGRNVLHFAYARADRPIDVVPGSFGIRPLAVAWDAIVVEGSRGAGVAARVEGSPAALHLPLRSRLDYHVEAADRLALQARIERANASDESPPTLRVTVEADGQAAQVRELRGPGPVALSFPLADVEPPVARLSLEAPEGAVRLVAPVATTRAHRPAPPVEPVVPPLPATGSPRNLVFFVVDTLRADHLGVYGYPHPTSPNLDRFAEDAIVFEDAVAASSWTRPAVATLFTGLDPLRHGVAARDHALSDEALTLAEILAAHGYANAAFVTNGNVAAAFGFDQGFDVFGYSEGHGERDVGDENERWVARRASHWLRERGGERPFFLYLHSAGPHGPYTAPRAFRERFAIDDSAPEADRALLTRLTRFQVESASELAPHLRSLYDAETARDDDAFGAVLRDLEALSLYDDTVVVFVSDHGEEFGDHGWWEHGKTLYAEQLRVPLVLKLAGNHGAGTRAARQVTHADLLPTLLDALGLPSPQGIDGRSALRPLDGERPAAAWLDTDGRAVRAIVSHGYKLIEHVRYDQPVPRHALYDTRDDPGDARNLAAERPVLVGYLRSLLEERERGSSPRLAPAPASTDDAIERQLRALGYLE